MLAIALAAPSTRANWRRHMIDLRLQIAINHLTAARKSMEAASIALARIDTVEAREHAAELMGAAEMAGEWARELGADSSDV